MDCSRDHMIFSIGCPNCSDRAIGFERDLAGAALHGEIYGLRCLPVLEPRQSSGRWRRGCSIHWETGSGPRQPDVAPARARKPEP